MRTNTLKLDRGDDLYRVAENYLVAGTGAPPRIVRAYVDRRARGDEELTAFNVACEMAKMLGEQTAWCRTPCACCSSGRVSITRNGSQRSSQSRWLPPARRRSRCVRSRPSSRCRQYGDHVSEKWLG